MDTEHPFQDNGQPFWKQIETIFSEGEGLDNQIFDEQLHRWRPEYGQHITPQDVVDLSVHLALEPILSERTQELAIYDGTCGTGGMLAGVVAHIREQHLKHQAINLRLAGQEINVQVADVCSVRLARLAHECDVQIRTGSTLSNDQFQDQMFDVAISNLPRNVPWMHNKNGVIGDDRFSLGIPQADKATWLFVQNMLAKLKSEGRALAITTLAPWTSGDARRTESKIRRAIVEKDWLETIIALPARQFYNTGISTFLCIFSKSKSKRRQGKVQLIDATNIYTKLSIQRYQANKQHLIAPDQATQIVKLYTDFQDTPNSIILDNEDLLYQQIRYRRTVPSWMSVDLSNGEIASVNETERIHILVPAEKYFAGTVKRNYPDAQLISAKPEIGCEVKFWHHFYEQKIKRIVKRQDGLERHRLRDLVEIRTTQTEFEEIEDSVYLPMFSTNKTTVSSADLEVKPQNYLQLILDTNRALPSYVAFFYNTELGQMIRESLSGGSTIPRINKTNLTQSSIYLPPLEMQKEFSMLAGKLASLETDVALLRAQLYSAEGQNVVEISETVDAYLSIQDEDKNFASWLDTLPFPLASILWRYHTANSNQKKVEFLFFFFEATSQFVATILLSAIMRERDVYEEQRQELTNIFQTTPLDKAAFGTWNNVVAKLGKSIRDLSNKKKATVNLKHLFATERNRIVQILASSQLLKIFDEVNSLRNSWKGHGGAANEQVFAQRHQKLKESLTETRRAFQDIWSNYTLILPTNESSYKQGVYTYKVQLVTGNQTPFISKEIKLEHPLEENNLHFWSPNSLQALQLVPLVKISPSPRKELNACYFYNRVEAGKIRFVSYHYDAEEPLIDDFPETGELIDALMSD